MKGRTLDEVIKYIDANSIIDEDIGCVLWQGCCSNTGYGAINYNGKLWSVHRLVYHILHPDEELKIIMHICDVRHCWNPDHLINGTIEDNIADCVSKGRHAFGSGVGTSVLTEKQILEIRNSSISCYQLADVYGVAKTTLEAIRRGETWKHVR